MLSNVPRAFKLKAEQLPLKDLWLDWHIRNIPLDFVQKNILINFIVFPSLDYCDIWLSVSIYRVTAILSFLSSFPPPFLNKSLLFLTWFSSFYPYSKLKLTNPFSTSAFHSFGIRICLKMWQWPAQMCINKPSGQVGMSRLERTVCYVYMELWRQQYSFQGSQLYNVNDGERGTGGRGPSLKFKERTHKQSELMNILISILLLSNIWPSTSKACPMNKVCSL